MDNNIQNKNEKKLKIKKRSNKDLKWLSLKEKIRERDHYKDRLLRILTYKEILLLNKNCKNKKLLKILDLAHIFSVSQYPELCYEESNIVLLNRYSHSNLDNLKDPITGEDITLEQRENWWKRIAGEEQWNKLLNIMINFEK